MAMNALQVKRSANVKEAGKCAWIHTGLRESWPFCQHRNRIMAMQAFLMAGNHTEIADARVILQLLAKQPRGIFNKNGIGRV